MSESSPTTEMIERELATLGEARPSAEELDLIGHADHVDHVGHADHVANVARLAELAEPIAFDDLSELETHRSWRSVELRLAQRPNTPGPGPGRARVEDEHDASTPTGGGPQRWLLTAVGIAAAAAVLLIVLRPFEQPKIAEAEPAKPDAELVAQLGERARVALNALDDGTSDTQRAEQLAADYRRQLEEQDG